MRYQELNGDDDAEAPAVIELQQDCGTKAGSLGSRPSFDRLSLDGADDAAPRTPATWWHPRKLRPRLPGGTCCACTPSMGGGGAALLLIFWLALTTAAGLWWLTQQQGAAVQAGGEWALEELQAAMRQAAVPLQVDVSRAACSGNGIQYLYESGCDCFPCFTGPDCAQEIPLRDCIVDAGSGTPLLFEDYWVAHPQPALVLKPSDHIGYAKSQSAYLEALIRRLHERVGNAVTAGRHVVIGHGSSQLINAAMFALADRNASEPASVYSASPYYGAYHSLATYWNSTLFRWHDGPPPAQGGSRVIEFVTSPNNPNGELRQSVVPGARAVYDHAYLWPHFTPISGPVEYRGEHIALFTLSKLTGHAGSRIGWAIVESDAVAERLAEYIAVDHWMVVENQLRAAAVLEYVLQSDGDIFSYAHDEMARRWDVLRQLLEPSKRFSMQELEPAAFDTWFERTRPPSPAYLWLTCNEEEDSDCNAALASAGIVGRPGTSYGASPAQARIELLMRHETFDRLVEKLRAVA